MADQIPRINFNRLILQLKPPCLCFQSLIVGLFMLAWSICSVQTATCPPSVPFSAATTTEQCNFTGYTNTYTFGVTGGPVSNSLYYLYALVSSSNSAAVRRVDASGSQTWMASLAFYPILKSLSVDAQEQSVYLASNTSPLMVLKLTARDGFIVNQHEL